MAITALVADTLTIPLAKEIFEAVKNYLETKRTSNKEKEELKKNLIKLVDLSNNSAVALNQYVTLMKRSTEASVHCTELSRLLDIIPQTEAKNQFAKVLDVRMQANLLKEGVESIHKYRDDYEKALGLYSTAEGHIMQAMGQLALNKNSSCTEIGYANARLNELVILAKRRIQELLEGLQEAYKVLGNMN